MSLGPSSEALPLQGNTSETFGAAPARQGRRRLLRHRGMARIICRNLFRTWWGFSIEELYCTPIFFFSFQTQAMGIECSSSQACPFSSTLLELQSRFRDKLLRFGVVFTHYGTTWYKWFNLLLGGGTYSFKSEDLHLVRRSSAPCKRGFKSSYYCPPNMVERRVTPEKGECCQGPYHSSKQAHPAEKMRINLRKVNSPNRYETICTCHVGNSK